MTTTIVMVLLLRKLIEDRHERWLYAGMIVIAANTGGAWSPIGDVTTIMLWVKGERHRSGSRMLRAAAEHRGHGGAHARHLTPASGRASAPHRDEAAELRHVLP